VDDALAAVQWVVQNATALGIDARRIAVAGDSAGGTLSAVVCLLAKRAGGPALAFQLLLYPRTGGVPSEHPSLALLDKGYALTPNDIRCAHTVPGGFSARVSELL
jgi:acetyl esterase